MQIIKRHILEIIFILILAVVIFISAKGSVSLSPLDYGKHMKIADNNSGVEPMSEYLNPIDNEDLYIIVVKGGLWNSSSQRYIDILKQVGFNDIDVLYDQAYHSFIGIISEGKVIYQAIGGEEKISYGEFIDGHYIVARSATENNDNIGEVYIDNVQYAINANGLNIVKVNMNDKKVIDSVAYDIFTDDVPMYRLVNFNTISLGTAMEDDDEI